MMDARHVGVAAVVLILGLVVPFVFMRMLRPSFAALPGVSNYRGRTVRLGLGVAWLVWAGCAIVAGIVGGGALNSTVLPILTLAGPLALVAFALGIVDDALGTGSDRGFKGHFRALFAGRMTTGMLKLIGIGVACAVLGVVAVQFAPWGGVGMEFGVRVPGWRMTTGVLLATASIALTSNFVNLMDLRPGRALKVYSALAVAGSVSAGVLLALDSATANSDPGWQARLYDTVLLLTFLLGPVIAVWSDDLGERGMLGDAGANPAGAVAGMMIVMGLPLWGLALYAAVMFALNLASERVSFSAVIERNALLRWFDRLGRPSEEPDTDDSSKSSPESEAVGG